MTGWPTHVAGHRSLWSLLRSHEPNLFHYLKDAGYEIAWHGKNDNLDADSLRADVAEHGAGAGTDHGGCGVVSPRDCAIRANTPTVFCFALQSLQSLQSLYSTRTRGDGGLIL